MLPFGELNYIAVIVTTVVIFIIGGLVRRLWKPMDSSHWEDA